MASSNIDWKASPRSFSTGKFSPGTHGMAGPLTGRTPPPPFHTPSRWGTSAGSTPGWANAIEVLEAITSAAPTAARRNRRAVPRPRVLVPIMSSSPVSSSRRVAFVPAADALCSVSYVQILHRRPADYRLTSARAGSRHSTAPSRLRRRITRRRRTDNPREPPSERPSAAGEPAREMSPPADPVPTERVGRMPAGVCAAARGGLLGVGQWCRVKPRATIGRPTTRPAAGRAARGPGSLRGRPCRTPRRRAPPRCCSWCWC